MPETVEDVGIVLLFDHARRNAISYIPSHCACPGCVNGWGHWPAVAR